MRRTFTTLLVLFGACGEGPAGPVNKPPTLPTVPSTPALPTTPTPPAPPAPPATISYVVSPPAGKLPYPFHNPVFTLAEYDAMVSALSIVNNYAIYQSGTTRASVYLHDGIDFMAPDGTPVFAVQRGIVRAVRDVPNGNGMVAIEDPARPGYGWSYAHVEGINVKVGDTVQQGTHLAGVRFIGLQHTHLSYMRMPEGADWGIAGMALREHLFSEGFFSIPDTEPPVFAADAFHYFRNDTESSFARVAGAAPVVNGDVDIVVGLRDRAPSARKVAGLPDRRTILRLEYKITGPSGRTDTFSSWDLSKLITSGFGTPAGVQAAEALTLFKYYPAVRSSGTFSQTGEVFYNITNAPSPAGAEPFFPQLDARNAWRTAERDAAGTALWPNGEYTVLVRAWDLNGNIAERSDVVVVNNP